MNDYGQQYIPNVAQLMSLRTLMKTGRGFLVRFDSNDGNVHVTGEYGKKYKIDRKGDVYEKGEWTFVQNRYGNKA